MHFFNFMFINIILEFDVGDDKLFVVVSVITLEVNS